MSSLAPPIALAGGSLIFLVIIIVVVAGIVFGLTRKGSGIDQHPVGAGRSEGPGVGQGSSRISSAEDEDSESDINSFGTG